MFGVSLLLLSPSNLLETSLSVFTSSSFESSKRSGLLPSFENASTCIFSFESSRYFQLIDRESQTGLTMLAIVTLDAILFYYRIRLIGQFAPEFAIKIDMPAIIKNDF